MHTEATMYAALLYSVVGTVDWSIGERSRLAIQRANAHLKSRLAEFPEQCYLTEGSRDRRAVPYPPATCEVGLR